MKIKFSKIRPKILAFAGSTRIESFNKKLVKITANDATEAGADVTVIDLRDYLLPLFDEDLEKMRECHQMQAI